MSKTRRKSAKGSQLPTGGFLHRRAPTVLVAVAVLGVVGLLIVSFISREAPAGGSGAAQAAPEVTFQVYGGPGLTPDATMKLSELRGKPVVLNFWAGLCPPCRAEMPDFQRIAQGYEGRVALVGIDIGPFVGLGSNADARKLLRDLGITYATGRALNQNEIIPYDILGMPTTFFLDAQGNITKKWSGYLAGTQMAAEIEELIRSS